MAKIYVSSTVADLQQERQAVMEWLVAARHQPVHSYRPDSDTARDSCLDDVDSCDLYVLILGHRYGHQPAEDNPGGLSITHLEFRRAGRSGLPRVALLRTSIPDVSVSDMEDPQRAALVLAFRAEVTREVRPAEFSDLPGLIQGLSTGVVAELEKQGKRPDGRRDRGSVLRLAPRVALLAGREELLAEVDGRLAGGAGQGPQVVALHGLGGAGKTSAAVEYAHRHLGEVGVAWQLPAEDATVLAAGFAELAAELDVQAAGGGDPVAGVHSALAAWRRGWLLIFDNVPDQSAVQRFLPPAGDGRVLITSQSAAWPPGQAVHVPPLGTEVAAVFLVNRTGEAASAAAAQLANELGGLPLALEQAGAYIQATGNTLAGYLSLLRDREADLLARGEAAGHRAHVAATLGLALSRLTDEAPAAAGLLRLLACLAPEPVPLTLLLADKQAAADKLAPGVTATVGPLLGDPLAIGDAVTALRRYSLVTPAGGGLVLMHRLVQAISFAQVPAEAASRWQEAAAALVQAAIPAEPDLPATWPTCAMLLPHAQTALTPASHGMDKIATYLRAIGNYGAAEELQRQILDACKASLGDENPRTLNARARLATLTGEAGNPAAARDQYAALVPTMIQILGAEHPDTLADRASLAYWTGEAGDPAVARDQYAALVPAMTQVLDSEHPAMLAALSNLTRLTGDTGNPVAARDQFAELLPIREQLSGSEHPATLTLRASLAYWTGMAGDPAAARDQYAALLPARQRVLGAEHPRTLTARGNLARWTGEAGNPAAARDQYAALLPVLEQVLGAGHPDTLTARGDLAYWTRQAENPDEPKARK